MPSGGADSANALAAGTLIETAPMPATPSAAADVSLTNPLRVTSLAI